MPEIKSMSASPKMINRLTNNGIKSSNSKILKVLANQYVPLQKAMIQAGRTKIQMKNNVEFTKDVLRVSAQNTQAQFMEAIAQNLKQMTNQIKDATIAGA